MIYSNTQYDVMYDNGKPMCFVGHTKYNAMLYEYFKSKRDCCILRVEEITQDIVDTCQFICAVSNVKFKKYAVDILAKFNPHYFTIIGNNNNFSKVNIGQGTYIQHNNVAVCEEVVIGDHCTVTSFITLSHHAHIGDYSHISPYCFINFADIGVGTVLGLHTTVMGSGDPLEIIKTPDYSNFLMRSEVKKSLPNTGTYYGHKYISSQPSIAYKIL
jgi:UDP-3-O-[3-hydroxymyristoyl] glucosamine N-acyltransferase